MGAIRAPGEVVVSCALFDCAFSAALNGPFAGTRRGGATRESVAYPGAGGHRAVPRA
jgi:hypothetical protein